MTEGLTGAVHETGHTLYEQGRNLEHDGLPVNEVGPCRSNSKFIKSTAYKLCSCLLWADCSPMVHSPSCKDTPCQQCAQP